MRRVGVVFAVIALAACSHGGHVSEGLPTTTAWNGIGTMLNADYICHTYVPGPIRDAITTTVEAFRELRVGPRKANTHLFPKSDPGDAAAWCWTGNPGAYNVYAVAQDGTAVKVASNMNVARYDEHGAPVIP